MDAKLEKALSGMILSASGWRGIFAENGEEESPEPGITESHAIISAAAAKVFSDYLKGVNRENGAVLVGRDTRPTGEAIADAIIRVLLGEGREVLYAGIAAAPEIMAFARTYNATDSGSAVTSPAIGFIYISASHNPIGHNGIKFGLTDGGVLQAGETARLVSAFRSLFDSPGQIEEVRGLLERARAEDLAAVYAASHKWKKATLEAYKEFSGEVISGFEDHPGRVDFFEALKNSLKKYPLSVAADFNGSARTVSIDRDFISSLGAGFYAINEAPGKIAHRIVPEGESLEPCRNYLEELHRNDPSVILGYTPDCDGDRGNLVIWDGKAGRARILEAQEVFALACMAELSSLVWTGKLKFDGNGKALSKPAIAVNDPTSLRIDRIAGFFGTEVYRAEVGEANVVGLARKLREDGFIVRILGEGSAGGTITHPSAVRDPIDTLGAILKLLAIRSGPAGKGLFGIWCDLSGQKGAYREDFTLSDIIATLPPFITTGAYSDDALLKVKNEDHGALKDKYQEIFLREWNEKKETLAGRFGITEWEAVAYNGIREKRGILKFGEAGRGGLKIEFFGTVKSPERSGSKEKKTIACIWMRGSGTEPVFRVMAEAEGSDPDAERFLIMWQRQMVLEADNA